MRDFLSGLYVDENRESLSCLFSLKATCASARTDQAARLNKHGNEQSVEVLMLSFSEFDGLLLYDLVTVPEA